jgi:hypothetical protein
MNVITCAENAHSVPYLNFDKVKSLRAEVRVKLYVGLRVKRPCLLTNRNETSNLCMESE